MPLETPSTRLCALPARRRAAIFFWPRARARLERAGGDGAQRAAVERRILGAERAQRRQRRPEEVVVLAGAGAHEEFVVASAVFEVASPRALGVDVDDLHRGREASASGQDQRRAARLGVGTDNEARTEDNYLKFRLSLYVDYSLVRA